LVLAFLSGILCQYLPAWIVASASVLLSSLCAIGTGIFSNQILLLVMIGLQGAFSAAAWVPMVDLVTDHVSYKNQGKSMGIVSSGLSVGIMADGLFIPIILNHGSWRMAWILFGSFGFVLGVIGTLVIYRIQKTQTKDHTYPRSREIRRFLRESSGLEKKTKEYWLLLAMLVFTGLFLQPYQTYIVPFMQEDMGLSQGVSGLAWSLLGGVGIASGLFGGILADKYTSRLAMAVTYCIATFSIVLVVFFNHAFTVILSCSLFGLAYNAAYGLHPIYVARIFPREQVSKFFGLLNLALGLGSTLGGYVGGYLQSRTGHFSLTYQLMCVGSLFLILICALIRTDRKEASLPLDSEL
jgi:MFS family permease